MGDKTAKKIPYGITDYVVMRHENYYYVDKTGYLRDIDNAGRFLFFIRPRRFGKSLFLSMMDAYYDILLKDRFEELFGDMTISKNPTEDRNKYLVLSFNFSGVTPDAQHVQSSFTKNVQGAVVGFIQKYDSLLSANKKLDYFSRSIEEGELASDILMDVVMLVKGAGLNMLVIIDEYDNFANSLLSTAGQAAYIAITHGGGFLRTFFNVLKSGTTGTNAPIKRLFITGVSPITMDDVTSGFNIGHNISLDASLNGMLGFTREDVITMLEYYRGAGLIKHDNAFFMEIFDFWYGNYLFSENAPHSERLYNTDMLLYLLREYFKENTLPRELIDHNVRIDYGKLRHLIVIDKAESAKPTTNGNFSKLKQVIEEQETSSHLVLGFPVEKLTLPENFRSLLFYFGLLTIKDSDRDQARLRIPNETIKRLYYDYIKEAYDETGAFVLDVEKYRHLMSDMAFGGKWKPLFDYITTRMAESMALRDLITGEKSIQAFLNVYLGLSDLYIIHAEKELNKGYADLVMEPFLARYEGIGYSFLLEIKYVKSGLKQGDPQVQPLVTAGRKQINQYALDKKFKKTIGKTKLNKLLLIFSGHCLVHMEEVV